METQQINIDRFLTADGKITTLPAKRAVRVAVLSHIASKFDTERKYTEKEVNQIIDQWHTLNDYFIIRRELIEGGFIGRTRSGSEYWRIAQTDAQKADQ